MKTISLTTNFKIKIPIGQSEESRVYDQQSKC